MAAEPAFQRMEFEEPEHKGIYSIYTIAKRLKGRKSNIVLGCVLILAFFVAAYVFGMPLIRPPTEQEPSRPVAPAPVLSQYMIDDIGNRTLGFQKVFVVSLPERTDHRDGFVLASAVSDFDVEFIDGIHAADVPEKALPSKHGSDLSQGTIGSWRAHMNAIQQVVHQGLSSAIIMEDDVDWDYRLKGLLRDFAVSSNGWLTRGSEDNINFANLPQTPSPNTSPYGDGWDMLWLGHCGMFLPFGSATVLHGNDDSVPQHRYLHSFEETDTTPLTIYPDHTRAIFRQRDATCSLVYAVSQASARSLLNELGLQRLEGPFDLSLRGWCEGKDGRAFKNCLTVLPQLFDHHRRVGSKSGESDISDHGNDFRDKAFTPNIRVSVRMNMDKIVRGDDPSTYDDQYPNE